MNLALTRFPGSSTPSTPGTENCGPLTICSVFPRLASNKHTAVKHNAGNAVSSRTGNVTGDT